MKKSSYVVKLTNAEAKRLAQYIKENGGGKKVGELFGVDPCTLSRTLNQHTAPSPMLRAKLSEVEVIRA